MTVRKVVEATGRLVVHRAPIDGAYAEVARNRGGTLDVPAGGTPLDIGALLPAVG